VIGRKDTVAVLEGLCVYEPIKVLFLYLEKIKRSTKHTGEDGWPCWGKP
jgi:hypothetical protein